MACLWRSRPFLQAEGEVANPSNVLPFVPAGGATEGIYGLIVLTKGVPRDGLSNKGNGTFPWRGRAWPAGKPAQELGHASPM